MFFVSSISIFRFKLEYSICPEISYIKVSLWRERRDGAMTYANCAAPDHTNPSVKPFNRPYFDF